MSSPVNRDGFSSSFGEPSSPPSPSSRPDGEPFSPFDDQPRETLQEEEEDGEELFGDNFERDYQPRPHLDQYDAEVLDDREYDSMSVEGRQAAERAMRKRDRQEALAQGRARPGLLYDESEEDEDEDEDAPRRRRRRVADGREDESSIGDGIEAIENLDDLRGHSVREWVSMEAPRAEIKMRFKRFLATYVNEHGTNVYREKIRQMCESMWVM